MDTALGFTTIFLLGLMFISVFKKHILIHFAIFFSAIGLMITYFQTLFEYKTFVVIALVGVCLYELYQMAKVG